VKSLFLTLFLIAFTLSVDFKPIHVEQEVSFNNQNTQIHFDVDDTTQTKDVYEE